MSILIGLYLLIESTIAASLMDKGDKLCRVAKYLVTGVCGMWMVLSNGVDSWHIIMGFALILFLWPKMLDRLFIIFGKCKRKCDRRRANRV